MEFSLRTDRRLLRAGAGGVRYLMVSLAAPVAPPRTVRPPVHVALVLDRSGSMDGERKFPLAREAVERSLAMLRPDDRFTLVVYDTEIDILAPATFATPAAKRETLRRLAGIEPRGGTDLHGGWVAGAAQLASVLSGESVNRALLLTDGQANHGIVDPAALSMQAAELRRGGVATSTFGVGADFDERLLRDLAHEGGGNFYFIETPAQLRDLLTSELGEALEVVARDVALQVVLPPGAEAMSLNRARVVHAAGDNELRVELGDLTSGQELTSVVRIRFPAGAPGTEANVQVHLVQRDADAAVPLDITWRYASHEQNDDQPRDRVVDREVARLYAARARAEAVEANRRGDLQHARRVLERTADRIRGYAGGDAELDAIWRALVAELDDFSASPMSAMELKSAFFVAESTAKGRAQDGRARRSRG